jgi:hypothetical protein
VLLAAETPSALRPASSLASGPTATGSRSWPRKAATRPRSASTRSARQGTRLRRGHRRHRRPPADPAAPDGRVEEDPARDRQGDAGRAARSACWWSTATPARTRWPRCRRSTPRWSSPGLVVTKLDGTAKGGVLAAIARLAEGPAGRSGRSISSASASSSRTCSPSTRACSRRPCSADPDARGRCRCRTWRFPRRRRRPRPPAPCRFAVVAAASPSARSWSISAFRAPGSAASGASLRRPRPALSNQTAPISAHLAGRGQITFAPDMHADGRPSELSHAVVTAAAARLLSSAERMSTTASTRDPMSQITRRSALSWPTRCSQSV